MGSVIVERLMSDPEGVVLCCTFFAFGCTAINSFLDLIFRIRIDKRNKKYVESMERKLNLR